MVDTDNWETQEGYICQGAVIGFCELGAAVVAGEPVAFGTGAQNKIVMTAYALAGDSVGVTLKGGVTGDKVPVVFYGVVKMVGYSTCTVGGALINSATAGTTITYGNVMPLTATATGNLVDVLCENNGTGTAHILGMALQNATTLGDELLVLVGGMR